MADWAELHKDLLAFIAKRLGFLEDFISFARVCKSWRSVAVKSNFNGSLKTPWLLLAEEQGVDTASDYRRLLSTTNGDLIARIRLPEAKGKQCSESLGWLVTLSRRGDMSLLNPLSRVQISLPHITTFQNYKDIMMPDIIRKAVLSSVPSPSSKDYALVVIYGGSSYLGLWRPGDETWTTIETSLFCPSTDIIFCKRQFYGLEKGGGIFACDVWGSKPMRVRAVGETPKELIHVNQPYLTILYVVESQGELLIVVRDRRFVLFADEEYCKRFMKGSFPDEYRIRPGSQEFRVFKVDLFSDGCRWEEIQSLGDNALFLGHNSSISVEASKFPGIKPNCIYYTDDCLGMMVFPKRKREEGKDAGIYNLEDRSKTTLNQGESCSLFYPTLWVSPSF